MSSSNDSAPSAGGGAPIAAIPAASIPLEAAESAERTAARASGVASNAFGVRDSQGIVPLSLPPEASYSSFKAAQDAANAYAGLAGYAIVEGKGRWADPRKKGRERRFLICKHGDSRPREKDGRELNESQRKRGKRQSKKTGCEVRIKVQERPDGSWDLKYLQIPNTRLITTISKTSPPILNTESSLRNSSPLSRPIILQAFSLIESLDLSKPPTLRLILSPEIYITSSQS
jgi:hypothetical protein